MISTGILIGSFVAGGLYMFAGLPQIAPYMGAIFNRKTVAEKLAEVFEACGLKGGKGKKEFPQLIRRQKRPAGMIFIYTIPSGLSISDFQNNIDAIETATNSSAKIWVSTKGNLCLDLAMETIPGRIEFEFEQVPEGMLLGIPVGWGRSGLIWLDLTEAPHLLIAGETFGGKSNCLHQALISILKNAGNSVRLFIIDLKRLEFSAYKNHAWYGYNLPEAIRILEYLTEEMHRRLELLDNAGVVKIQDYYKLQEEGMDLPELPLTVLAIDELSQLNPDGEPVRKIKKVKEYAQQMLQDLAAIARCVGIHLILSTQRPDHKVVPGGLKANIPAKICYPVTSRVNSQIILDNDAGYYLPRKKGRCVYKFNGQQELQTMFLETKRRLKKVLKSIPPVKVKHEVVNVIEKMVEDSPL